jgi:hypothetical protein
MANSERRATLKILEPLPADLMEEYKVCQQKASSLGDSIWKTAVIFGVGSVAGIVALSRDSSVPDELRPWLLVVLSLFAVGILLTWRRLAHRWWSIEQAMFRRMEHIERESLLRANLYVGHLDERVDFTENSEEGTYSKPFLEHNLLTDFDDLRRNYENRGIRPMMRFVIEINIAAWAAFALLSCAELVSNTMMLNGSTVFKLVVVVAFTGFFFGRLLTLQQRP